ncbi:MAG: hypothetical protein A2Z77_02400 [Chloroflexi bacterium RBG_13_51_36]|nr:MAG: hypothetical protein A2Z77_02400 [Chloroflexi bacterium RBG_13_51_36]
MSHLDSYINRFPSESREISAAITQSVNSLWDRYLFEFNYNSHLIGLLFGQVQSGKTSHLLGVISKAADEGFKLFILLTTDNVSLQRQTLERALYTLDSFNVCDETDDMRFRVGGIRKPVLIVLKKNQSVLRTWTSHLASLGFSNREPLFIVDDEGDAATLNTLINVNDQSRINSLVNGMRSAAPSSVFLSVTATPQALILQTRDSIMRPSFAHLIEPGASYLGGEFFYGEDSRCPHVINEAERRELLSPDDVPPEGLRKAILSFLMSSVHRHILGSSVTNMLIHPSLRIRDHSRVEAKVKAFLKNIANDLEHNSQNFKHVALDAWNDLNTTQTGLTSFEESFDRFKRLVTTVKVLVINSNSLHTSEYENGLNIIIGGNSLGRGLTFPGLHTVYYSRTAKTPQADTFWQHSRMFGYDRIPGLCRVYLPPSLLHLFRELNEANQSMVKILRTGGIDHISLLSPQGTRPTRPNVVRTKGQVVLIGGVNYFPQFPISSNVEQLDRLLDIDNKETLMSLEESVNILRLTAQENGDSFEKQTCIDAVDALGGSKYDKGCRLIVRTNRSISKGTGTLLSPDDRALSNSYENELALTMYRLNGETDKGWRGKPLWVPNIKLPAGRNYCSTE